METLIQLGLTLAVLTFAYFVGSMIERRHFVSLREREARHRGFPTVTFETLPAGWRVAASGLAVGNTVVSLDYFKRFLAGLRGIVGGRIKSYEPLLDRARREALLRMTEHAVAEGYDAIVNVRLETSRLASSRGNGKGTSGVEVLAYGTAIKLVR